ncbi:lysylphosphatidylglycerol synthase domain-containing protein [Nocardioides ferulae]|uniref:lysylphosphatidylglycerol synthase domain-containing protein n=1 Tax=Nocardioides ferulae TaxID=2340821 RepID=UPI0013DDA6F7|nr:lysylphosphatidylglycerol synthase domain-containing protein [Nocardioides ferulae]
MSTSSASAAPPAPCDRAPCDAGPPAAPASRWRRAGHTLKRAAHSRTALIAGILVSLVVPAVTLPRLPSVSWWPLLLGLLPWVLGKYLLCPLRWRALTGAGLTRRWHLRAYAESELLGLLTPGHVGADLWRMHRLTGTGLGRGDAVLSVALDRFVGALGLTLFVAFAGTALPTRMLLGAFGLSLLAVLAFLVVRRVRPQWLPTRPLPRPRQLAHGLWLSGCYQASIAALLLGTVAATGHEISPLTALGAFGASQLAGAIPGPNGASPRDGALVLALVSAGVPWTAAAAAVSLKAALAWLPALLLGGVSLLATRYAARRQGPALALPA